MAKRSPPTNVVHLFAAVGRLTDQESSSRILTDQDRQVAAILVDAALLGPSGNAGAFGR